MRSSYYVACVAGGFVRAGQKSWRRSREKNGAEAASGSRFPHDYSYAYAYAYAYRTSGDQALDSQQVIFRSPVIKDWTNVRAQIRLIQRRPSKRSNSVLLFRENKLTFLDDSCGMISVSFQLLIPSSYNPAPNN